LKNFLTARLQARRVHTHAIVWSGLPWANSNKHESQIAQTSGATAQAISIVAMVEKTD